MLTNNVDDAAVPVRPAVMKCRAPRARCRTICRGTNPFLEDYAKKHNLPVEAVRGGAETALPEFMNGRRPRRRRAAGAE